MEDTNMQESEREAFEEWFEADAMPAESDWFKQDSDGDYVLPFVQHAWEGWQARAALSTSSPKVPAAASSDEDSAFWDWIKAEKEAGRDHHVFAAKAGFDAGRALTDKGERK